MGLFRASGFPAGLIVQPQQYSAGLNPRGGLSQNDLEEVRRFYPPIRAGTSFPKLKPYRSQSLSVAPAEQRNFVIEPTETRRYTISTFGQSDTVMVLFEDRNGDMKYVAGDDDSGRDRNARIAEWLTAGKKYVLRIRLYLNYSSGDTAVMLW